MKKTMYRVGVPWTEFPEDGFTYLMPDSDPTNKKTFTGDRFEPFPLDRPVDDAALYDAKTMSTWVQVLASRYECVVVERVEVADE
ncbi:hypothetical protein [Alloalcanivorax mobilis]|uniref:hypothetical protein n=1 Tax=Alloalcanivorax mobilis TaxID=2019569 RepID=UPI0012FFF121|nr:hypothetical protein [Alloalcanivorax mobilis]